MTAPVESIERKLWEQAIHALNGGDAATLAAVASRLVRVQAKPGTGFDLVGGADLWAPLEPPDPLVSDVLQRGELLEIAGYGAGSKTWMAVNLAVSVGTGTPWLDRFPTKLGRVAYLDWENGSYELRRRLQAVAVARGILEPVPNVSASFFPAIYMSAAGFEPAIATLGAAHDLVIIDTLRAASPHVDENDSAIRAGLDVLRRVGETTKCAFVVLVHSKKTSGNPNAIDPREHGRGSSGIFDAADKVMLVTYSKDDSPPFRVQQTKSRSGKGVAEFGFELVDAGGGVLLRAEDLPSGELQQSDRFEGHCEKVLAAVRENPRASGRLLVANVGGKTSATYAALERLERDGAVKNLGAGKSTQWVAVAAAPEAYGT